MFRSAATATAFGATLPLARASGKDGCPCICRPSPPGLRLGEPPRASWIEASVTKVARVSARFSKSLARHRFRPNQEKRRGEAIPDVAKLAGTSLDTPTELDALAKRPQTN